MDFHAAMGDICKKPEMEHAESWCRDKTKSFQMSTENLVRGTLATSIHGKVSAPPSTLNIDIFLFLWIKTHRSNN